MEKIWIKFLLPFFMPLAPTQRIFFVYLATAIVLAGIVYIIKYGNRDGFLQYCFPRAVFLHPSALVDYLYFIVNKIACAFLLVPLVIGSELVSTRMQAALTSLYGGPGSGHHAGLWTNAAFTLAMILAFDLALFIAHYLQHKAPLLWQFHKVHHSAAVLTPITVYRMHPVDDLLAGTLVGLLTGLVHGSFAYHYAGGMTEFTVYGINVALFAFYLFGYNLRHSHIWLSYPAWLSHLLVSPAQHQIHHSAEVRHFDRNIGFMFAFWDWIVGTLYVPKTEETFELGLDGGEHREFDSVWKLYVLPFKKAAALFARGPRGQNA